MAKVRLKVVAKELNLGITTIVDFLKSIGALPYGNPSADSLYIGLEFDSDPNQWLDTKYIPQLIEHFGYIPPTDAVFSISDNPPVWNAPRYLSSPLGKKIMFLDGFCEENSESILHEYKQVFKEGISGCISEEAQTLYRITSLAKSILGDVISDENDFLDCCVFYSCTSDERDAPPCYSRERRIREVIAYMRPDCVFVLSPMVAMYLDVADGEGPLVRKFLYAGSPSHAEFFYVKEPLRLEKRDLEDVFPFPVDRQSLEHLYNQSFFKPADKNNHFVKTVFGSAESITFEDCEKVFDFLVHEGKIDDTIENKLLLTYRLSGKIPYEYSNLTGTRIVWKGCSSNWDWTLGYFVNKLTGGKYGKPWVIAVNSFCYREEDKSEHPKEGDNGLLRDEFCNKVTKSSIAQRDPFAIRLTEFLPKKDNP